MKLLDKIREWNRINLAEVMLPGYIFNKNLFRVAIALVAVVLIAVAFQIGIDWNGSKNIYVNCPNSSSQPCANPFYNSIYCSDRHELENPDNAWRCQEVLLPGESYGKEPAPLTRTYGLWIMIIISTAILFNHLGFNRGYFKAHKKELLERLNDDERKD